MKKQYFILFILFGMFSCAIQKAPTGGPKDTTPPKVDEPNSTANYQTNFDENEFHIEFDEFITFRSALKNTLISPPLEKNPEIKIRGKQLIVKFDKEEKLKKNATYVFNFQDGLKDYTNGNAYQDLRFVFSTGDFLDSLSIGGKVTDAKLSTPVENVIVALYENLSDTAVYKQKPFYISTTDKEGHFQFENIRKDKYKIYAFQDENVNYKYDPKSESFGFLDTLLVINDSLNTDINLQISKKEPKLKIKDSDGKTYGKYVISFNKPIQNAQVTPSIQLENFYSQIKDQDLVCYYENQIDTSFSLFININNILYDTLKVRKLSKSKFIENAHLKMIDNNLDRRKSLSPNDTLMLKFNHPIAAMQGLFQFHKDSANIEIQHAILAGTTKNEIFVLGDWQVDSLYEFTILPHTFIDIYGMDNDSLSFHFTQNDISKYGNIVVTLDSLRYEQNLVIQLLKNDKIVKEKSIQYKNKTSISFNTLPPGLYTLIYFIDNNKNGKWNPANFETKTQAEKYFERKLEELRENWDLEVSIEEKDF